jgi:hypothetical protein
MMFELRVQCGLEIMRLQFFRANELAHLTSLLKQHGPAPTASQRA